MDGSLRERKVICNYKPRLGPGPSQGFLCGIRRTTYVDCNQHGLAADSSNRTADSWSLAMTFEHSAKVKDLQARLVAFLNESILPNERTYREQRDQVGRWNSPPIMDELKVKARAAG